MIEEDFKDGKGAAIKLVNTSGGSSFALSSLRQSSIWPFTFLFSLEHAQFVL